MKRVGYLDGIRGLGLICVVLFHWAALMGYYPLPGGYVVVDTFFVLSGFLITSILMGSRAASFGVFYRAFIRARVARLYPALVAVVVAVFLVGHTLPVQDHMTLTPVGVLASLGQFTWFTWLRHINTGHGLDQGWSLGAEWGFYIGWPLVVWALRRRLDLLLRLTVVTALVSYALAVVVLPQAWFYWSPLGRADQLLAGSALAVVYLRRGEKPMWSPQSATGVLPALRYFVPLAVLLAWIAKGPLFDSPWYKLVGHPLGVVSVLALIVAGRTYAGAGNQILSSGPLRAAGVVSYSVYLWHWPVLLSLATPAFGLSHFSFTILGILLTGVLSGLSFWFLERPHMARKPGARGAAPEPRTAGIHPPSAARTDATPSTGPVP